MKTTLIAAAMIAAAGVANAGTQVFTDSVAITTTNWTNTLAVQQFDAALGTLDSVTLALTGTVLGNASAESQDAGASTVTLDLSAEITASTTALGDLVSVLPVAIESFAATAFDGTIDFGGTSGASFLGLTNTDSDSETFTGGDVAAFIGTGTIDVVLASLALSSATGPGNVISFLNTEAGADLTVTYNFTPTTTPVPLPAAAPLMLVGMGALAMVRRAKRKS